jgi:hypothetical protein
MYKLELVPGVATAGVQFVWEGTYYNCLLQLEKLYILLNVVFRVGMY